MSVMIMQIVRGAWLGLAVLFAAAAFVPVRAEESEAGRPALAASLAEAKIALESGLKSSEREGQAISAKFEIDEGRLQLSVYTVRGDGFSEVVIDPRTGDIAKAEKIVDTDDLAAAAAQRAAMERAQTSLFAATEKSVKANVRFRAVSITPKVAEGHPLAEVTLLQGTTFKTVTEKLD